MRALVAGASGAVGRVTVETLRAWGHEVTGLARRPGPGLVPVDLAADPVAVARLARDHDVVIDATGADDPRPAGVRGDAAWVDVSASGRHLEALSAVPAGRGVLLGAGLAPGLSTMLVAALGHRPGDAVDVGVVLGAGEQHGAAAVAWTAALAGTRVHRPPEGAPVRNLREGRRLPVPGGGTRRHLRADFPDHLLVGLRRGIEVRTYLALDSTLATTGLAAVGLLPRLAPVLRHAPHVGSERWSVVARVRRTGRTVAVRGTGQSRATGVLAARGAVALVEAAPRRAVAMPDLLGPGHLADLAELVDGEITMSETPWSTAPPARG